MGWMCKIYIGKICKIRYILVAFFIALVMTLQKQNSINYNPLNAVIFIYVATPLFIMMLDDIINIEQIVFIKIGNMRRTRCVLLYNALSAVLYSTMLFLIANMFQYNPSKILKPFIVKIEFFICIALIYECVYMVIKMFALCVGTIMMMMSIEIKIKQTFDANMLVAHAIGTESFNGDCVYITTVLLMMIVLYMFFSAESRVDYV